MSNERKIWWSAEELGMTGEIVEIRVAPRPPSAKAMRLIHRRLAKKYGLSWWSRLWLRIIGVA